MDGCVGVMEEMEKFEELKKGNERMKVRISVPHSPFPFNNSRAFLLGQLNQT